MSLHREVKQEMLKNMGIPSNALQLCANDGMSLVPLLEVSMAQIESQKKANPKAGP